MWNSKKSKKVDFSKNWYWMSSSWDEFLPSKIRTLGVVGRFCTKIDHDTSFASILLKNDFLMIFDFWIVGLWTLAAEFWFILHCCSLCSKNDLEWSHGWNRLKIEPWTVLGVLLKILKPYEHIFKNRHFFLIFLLSLLFCLFLASIAPLGI